jgi:hypothetical protein
MIGWKEAREPALAVAAALPLLQLAGQLVIVAIDEGSGNGPRAVGDLARQLA